MPLAGRKWQLAAKVETTQGTIISLAAADANFRVWDLEDDPVINTESIPNQGAFGDANSVATDKQNRLRFKTRLHGAGVSAAATWHQTLFRSSGMTLSGSTYSFSSDTSAHKSVTMAKLVDGWQNLGRGGMGNCVLRGEGGKPVVCEWDYMLAYPIAEQLDAALLVPTYDTAISPIQANASSMTLDGGTSLPIATWALDLGNKVELRQDVTAAGGYRAAFIGDREPTLNIDVEASLLATKNWYDKLNANTNVAHSIVVGTSALNTMTLTLAYSTVKVAPKTKIRAGVLAYDLQFRILQDSLTIAFS